MEKLLLYIFSFIDKINRKKHQSDVLQIRKQTKKAGVNFAVGYHSRFKNPKYMEFGENFFAMDRFRIEAWDKFRNQNFSPSIKIGSDVNFNTDIHIACINSITIGDDCLFANRIFITDHHHGSTSKDFLDKIPDHRLLVSKGAVVIGNNVLVGEGVAIMPGVTIGANSIIGANSVVTKSVPANSVVVGIPSRVVKIMD